MKKLFRLIVSLLIFSAAPLFFQESTAKGIIVSPSSVEWDKAQVGAPARMPVNIVIKNDSKEPRLFILKIFSPQELNLVLSEDFQDIPSAGWITFGRGQVSIEPGRWAQVKVFLNVPRERKYLNKKWEFFIEVKQSPQGRELFELACYTKVNVHTQKRFFSH